MNTQNIEVFILNPILSFKVTKFLVKISRFEFLVMTEKIFLFIFFCHQIFLTSFYFFCKIATSPLKKLSPLFQQPPPLKLEGLSSPPFWKFGRRLTPPLPSRKGGAHYEVVTPMLFKVLSYFCVWKQIIFSKIKSDIHNLFQVRSCCYIVMLYSYI